MFFLKKIFFNFYYFSYYKNDKILFKYKYKNIKKLNRKILLESKFLLNKNFFESGFYF
jgi:hypothetical protein